MDDVWSEIGHKSAQLANIPPGGKDAKMLRHLKRYY
jgi:hypothetical protein